jgi:5-methylcytosine-specific restriction protein A
MTTPTNHGFTSMARRSGDGNVVRLRGRRLVVRNARLLKREPLCRRCLKKHDGRIRPATQLDHVVPLAKGGRDTEDNLQPLCDPCHVEKTAEDFGKQVWPTVKADGWPDLETGYVPNRST